MKRIALLYTGGTIGAVVKNGCADAQTGASRVLTARYRRDHPDAAVLFEESEPLTTLSENMTVDKWNLLLEALHTQLLTEPDGIVVTHGTDTLSFTAGLLAVAFADAAVPILLVSSHTPPADPLANGHRHFAAAVEAVRQGHPAGVYAVLSEQGAEGPVRIVRASDVTQCMPLSHQFGVVPGKTFPPLKETPPRLSPCVQIVRPYPGLDYRTVALPAGTRAVLHSLYHSGTACMEGEHTGLNDLTARCREAGIPLFVCPAPAGDAAYQYGTSLRLFGEGVYPLRGMTLESAYGLLLIGCACCGDTAALLQFLQGYA